MGDGLAFTVRNLKPATQYEFKLKLTSIGDESPYSEIVSITTPESSKTSL